jgi:hypothetical protein
VTVGNALNLFARHSLVGIVSFAAVITIFSHFGNYDPPVSFLKAEPIPYSVRQGESFNINWEVERTRRCGVRFDREIYANFEAEDGGKRIEMADIVKEGGRPISARDKFSTEVLVPDDMPLGKAKYVSVGLYDCNLFQKWKPIIVPAPEVEFMVLPRAHTKSMDHSNPG